MCSTEPKISWRASASPPALVFDKKTWGGSRRNRNIPVGSIIFFACFYLYVWLFIEPRLIYHGFGTFTAYPAFSVDWEFLRSSLSYPGGVVEYIGGFLSQLYYFSWLGALVVTAVALSLYIATRMLISMFVTPQTQTGQVLKLICYIPAAMLLMIHNRYDSQLTAFIALLAALWFTVAYEKLSPRNSITRMLVFLVMFAMLYYIAVSAIFIFAFLAAIHELFVRRRRILSVLFLTTAIGTTQLTHYLVLRYIFGLETEIIYQKLFEVPLEYDPRLTAICIYFFFPLVLFVVGLWGWKSKVKSKKLKVKSKKSGVWRFSQNNKVKWAIEATLLAAILVVSIFASFDGTKKKLVQVDYFAHQRMWPEVLQTARRIRPESYDAFCIHDINRALYYTGRLGDEMFCYPQQLPALLLTNIDPKKLAARRFMKSSELLLKLGYTGGSEKDAFEFMEIVGNSPLILEQLAKIKLAKGQVEAAKVFLRVLSKDLIFGHRGREMLQHLEDDPELANDKTIQHIRSVMIEKDSDRSALEADAFFYQLLDKNKNNKMAFEYMMAFYLLTGQTGKLIENIGRLNEIGYNRLPQYYEEAIVIYIMGTGGKKMDLHGWQLQPETIMQGAEFSRIYSRNQRNIQNARDALVSNFGKSYFFYYIFELPKIMK